MARTIILCTDGSDLAIQAATKGLDLLRPADQTILVTVIDTADPTLLTGASGFAGGTVTPEAFEELQASHHEAGEAALTHTVDLLDGAAPDNMQTKVLVGSAGPALCIYAAEIDATTIVMGSRGRGGLKRAVLGSVSDHVVRNAPCAVFVLGDGYEPAEA